MEKNITAFEKTDNISIDDKYLYIVIDGDLEKGQWEDVLLKNLDIFEDACKEAVKALEEYIQSIPPEENIHINNVKPNDFEILKNYDGNDICLGVSTQKIGITGSEIKAIIARGSDIDANDNSEIMRTAKDLIHIARSLVAGNNANKDGKYGSKNSGWTGRINYNGTAGIVTNASFELKNGRVIWQDGTWEEGVWAYGLWKNGWWKQGVWQVGEWLDGIWENGEWQYGTWQTGIWKGGHWQNGTWKNGVWETGTHDNGWWENGIWKSGIWNNGTFWNGTWESGTWKDGLNWYGIFNNCDWKGGQWNEGTWNSGKWHGGKDKKQIWHPENASPNKWVVSSPSK